MRFLVFIVALLVDAAEFQAGEYGIMHKSTGRFLGKNNLCWFCQTLIGATKDVSAPMMDLPSLHPTMMLASPSLALTSRSQMIRWTLNPMSGSVFRLEAKGSFKLNAPGVLLEALSSKNGGLLLKIHRDQGVKNYLYSTGAKVYLRQDKGSSWELVSLAEKKREPLQPSINVRFRTTSSNDVSVNFGPADDESDIGLLDVSLGSL